MSRSIIRQSFPLGTQWPTIDPFLFVAHHLDDYPEANDRLGPAESLDGRDLGQDFGGKGFPLHMTDGAVGVSEGDLEAEIKPPNA